jgi:hypothetical protein
MDIKAVRRKNSNRKQKIIEKEFASTFTLAGIA